MALRFGNFTLDGTDDADTLIGWGSPGNTNMNGAGGNDFALGDIGYFFALVSSQVNDSIASAYNIDAAATWSTSQNDLIFDDGAAAHCPIYVETTALQADFYSVTVAAGQTLTVDIDRAINPSNRGTIVNIYDGAGTLLQRGYSGGDGQADGSRSGTDGFVQFVAPANGTYYIKLADATNNNGIFQAGESFMAFVSVTGHAATGTVAIGDDVINGDAGDDTLFGMGGNDTISGGDGGDRIAGGSGVDRLVGGSGYDVFFQGNGEELDDIDGGTEGDWLDASAVAGGGGGLIVDLTAGTWSSLGITRSLASIEYVTASQGNDTIITSTTSGFVDAAAGDDIVHVSAGSSVASMNGGAGNDLFDASDWSGTDGLVIDAAGARWVGSSVSASFQGFEQLIGSHADDTISVTLLSSSRTSTLDGGDGNDHIVAYGGVVVTGGAGVDTLDLSAVTNAAYALLFDSRTESWTVNGATAAIDGIEVILGTQQADTIFLNEVGNDRVEGNGGDDRITLGNSDDFASGDAGADTIDGGAGNDLLFGGDGADVLDGGSGVDLMEGGTGDDTFYVDHNDDLVVETYGQGIDLVRASVSYRLSGNVENLILSGTATSGTGNVFANEIIGGTRSEALSGGGGDDSLQGRGGQDILAGEDGADMLLGGAGRDTLTGGAGSDVFRFADGDLAAAVAQSDRITDFSHDQHDRISLRSIDADRTVAGDQAFTFIGENAFSGVAGQLRAYASGGDTILAADTNGDGTADFTLSLTGDHDLVAKDFFL